MSPAGTNAHAAARAAALAQYKATVKAGRELIELRAALAAVRALCADATNEGVGMVPVCAVLAVMSLEEAPSRPVGALRHPAGTQMPTHPKESNVDAAHALMTNLLAGPTS